MTDITIGTAVIVAVMGYAVVFFGLVLLMIVLMVMGKIMMRNAAKSADMAAPAAVEAAPVVKANAPGSAGILKLYDTDPKDAAMIMAIVADSLGKPVNELRFISIREVKE